MTLSTSAALLALALALGAPPNAHAQTPPAVPAEPSALYVAFGEKAGIASLMSDFVRRLKADPRTASFFEKTNSEELARQLTDQLCMLSGGPCRYSGAKMKAAHADMDIGSRHFNALVEVLQDSMDARGIPFGAQNRMLALLAPMHRDVVTRP